MSTTPIRLIHLPIVEGMTGLRRSAIYGLVSTGEFPPPRKVTERATRWVESEVADWCAGRPVGTVPSISPVARRRDEEAATLAVLRDQAITPTVAAHKAPREQRDSVVRRKPGRPRKHAAPLTR